MSPRYLLDTNIVSHLIRGHPAVSQRIVEVPMSQLFISAITEGELLYGVARRPGATRLRAAVREFLLRVEVLPWNSEVAARYGEMRAELERRGRSLDALDLLIAAHAAAENAVLVTADGAFAHAAGLRIEDWTED
jgi:tRNA(fMet)-specific endonuclease VapC